MPESPSWSDIFKNHAFLIALLISAQFFVLILFFSFWPSQMDREAKSVILQTYVIAFTASWNFFLGQQSVKPQPPVEQENK